MASNQDSSDNTCVVCFKNVEYYSIGECDHPVCYECSTRMRVLCLQNECPICRQELSKVVFTSSLQPYKKLKNREFSTNQYERKYKINFISDEVYNAYLKLLEHKCKPCESVVVFKSFEMLHDHMKKEHELFYCDLCIANLKIFTFERKCYTRQKLALHRRKGDADDTSHRGHPMCQFCQLRYMDNDDLFRHLRKQHLYCHLCDADGLQQYYDTHARLFEHYRQDHFVCEEGECRDQNLTAVFRTEIDLKAHKASVHGRGLPRAAARQARTLELHFALTPRPPPPYHNQAAQSSNSQPYQRPISYVEVPEPPLEEEIVYSPPSTSIIDTCSIQDFPSLSGKAAAAAVVPLTNIVPPPAKGRKSKQGYDENFPALDGNSGGGGAVRFNITHQQTGAGPSPAVIRTSSKPNVSIPLHGHQPTANNFRLAQASTSRTSQPSRPAVAVLEDDFPSLGMNDNHPSIGASVLQKPKVAVVSHNEFTGNQSKSVFHNKQMPPPKSEEAFPALSGSSGTPPPPTWITVKNKDKGKKSKVAPPPEVSPVLEQGFDSFADFPILKGKNKSKKKTEKMTNSNNNNNIEVKNENIDHFEQREMKQNGDTSKQMDKKQQNSKKKKKGKENSPSRNVAANIIHNAPKENDTQRIDDHVSYMVSEPNEAMIEKERLDKSEALKNASVKKVHSGSRNETLLFANDNTMNVQNGNDAADMRHESRSAVERFRRIPPPGFTVKAPPGFATDATFDGLMFTNSSGQSYFAPEHKYVQPPDFHKRNKEILIKFSGALGTENDIQEFRKVSQSFRDGFMSGLTYYDHCLQKMGSKCLDLFPELVALLPNIKQQQELQLAWRMKRGESLPACAVCGQVLVMEDSVTHSTSHWPSLSGSAHGTASARVNRDY